MNAQPPPLPSTAGPRLARLGLWLQLAPLIDVVPVLRRLWGLFQETQTRMLETGAMPDVALLSSLVRAAFSGSYVGTGLSLLGAVFILVAYVKHRHRPAWARMFLLAMAGLGLLSLMMLRG